MALQELSYTLLHTLLHIVLQEVFQEVFQKVFQQNFGRLNGWQNPSAKVIDFVPLGVLSGPGAPDPDLGISWYIDSWDFTHVFEKEAESQELLKKRVTTLKKC